MRSSALTGRAKRTVRAWWAYAPVARIWPEVDGVKIYTTVNRDAAGKISKVFVTTDREGTTIMGLLNSLSKTISVTRAV